MFSAGSFIIEHLGATQVPSDWETGT